MKHTSLRQWITWLLAAWLVSVLATSLGCGERETGTVLDASALLDRYEKDRRRHDPVHFSEVDVGDFTVTKRREPAIFYIRFRLYAIVPDNLLEEFANLRETHGERLRGQVREAVQSCDIDQLDDPSLGWLKSELIRSLNRSLEAPILRDVRTCGLLPGKRLTLATAQRLPGDLSNPGSFTTRFRVSGIRPVL